MMDPFLKKEWENTKIPHEIYLRVRNQAWRKLQRKQVVYRRWLLATASSAALLCLIFFFPRSGFEKRELDLPLPSTPLPLPVRDVSELVLRPANPPAPVPASQLRAALSEKPEPPVDQPEPAPSEARQRIVLNFQLPETGVRMIWIMDSEFDLFETDGIRTDSN